MIRGGYFFERITAIAYEGIGIYYFSYIGGRKILVGLNVFLSILCTIIAVSCIFCCSLVYDAHFTAGWVNWMGLSIVGVSLVVVSLIGIRAAHTESLDMLLAYFWGIIIFVAPLVLGLFACFNFVFFLKTWFLHVWALPRFSAIREYCCEEGTANNECLAPIVDLNLLGIADDLPTFTNTTYNVTAWCIEKYNSTLCTKIRDKAIDRAVEYGGYMITTQISLGVAGLIIIGISIYMSSKMLTSLVITQSMNDMINYLLVLPIAGSIGLTVNLWWMLSDDALNYNWLPYLYMGLGLAQLAVLPMGISAGRMKSRGLLRCYLGAVIAIIAALALASVTAFTLAKIVRLDYMPSQGIINDIACRKELTGCCCCGEQSALPDEDRCPEWSRKEVLTLLSLDLRLAGMVTTVSMLYLTGAFIVTALVHKELKNYKSDFV